MSSTMSVLDKSTICHPANSWTPYIVDVDEVTASGTALADTAYDYEDDMHGTKTNAMQSFALTLEHLLLRLSVQYCMQDE